MDQILKQLLSSELLSEEAREEISTQWASATEQYKEAVREEVTLAARKEIAEQWNEEREQLISSVETFITHNLTEQMAEFSADVERFRDIEAEYAEKLTEQKHALSSKLSEELDSLIDKMDAFFELRLTEELSELKEDLQTVKQNNFGKRMFEAFTTEFNTNFVDEDSVQSQLVHATDKLHESEQKIKKLEESASKMLREAKLEKILSNLTGSKKEQMAFVLDKVPTARLEEAFNTFIGRVLKDSPAHPEVEPTLNESVVVTGNESSETVANKQAPAVDKHLHLKKLAGIA
jgi:hypothetical protein